MKFAAALSVAALFSGSASAGPIEARTRVPVKGINCNLGRFSYGAVPEALSALNRLRNENPKFERKIAPGKCDMRSDYGTARVWICNDNSYDQPVNNIDAYEIGFEAWKKCSPQAGHGYFNAQAFTTHNWNVIVRGA